MERNEDWKSWVYARGLPPRVVKLLESQEVNSLGDLKRLDPVDWVDLIGITGVLCDVERCQLKDVLDELQQSPHLEDLTSTSPQSPETGGTGANPCCSSDSEDCSLTVPAERCHSGRETECHKAQPPTYGFRQWCSGPRHDDEWKSWVYARGLPPRVVKLLESQEVNSLGDLKSRDPVEVVDLIGIAGDLCDIERCQLKDVLDELQQSPHLEDHSQWCTGPRREGDLESCRLVLLGKTGNGKSTTGNTILGRNGFDSGHGFASLTKDCTRASGCKGNTQIEIVDVPGLFDTKVSPEKIGTLIAKAVVGMHPGPDAILFVLQIGSRFTEEEYGAYQRVKALFDEHVCKYIILLFTRGDILDGRLRGVEASDKVARMIADDGPEDLRVVFRECGGRAVVFENQVSEEQDKTLQVEYLLQVVKKLKASNRNIPYSCPKYREIGRSLEEEVSKRMQKLEKEVAQRMGYVQRVEKDKEEAERKQRLAENKVARQRDETPAVTKDPEAELRKRWREDDIFRHKLRMIEIAEMEKLKQAFVENKEQKLSHKVMLFIADTLESAAGWVFSKAKCTVS